MQKIYICVHAVTHGIVECCVKYLTCCSVRTTGTHCSSEPVPWRTPWLRSTARQKTRFSLRCHCRSHFHALCMADHSIPWDWCSCFCSQSTCSLVYWSLLQLMWCDMSVTWNIDQQFSSSRHPVSSYQIWQFIIINITTLIFSALTYLLSITPD